MPGAVAGATLMARDLLGEQTEDGEGEGEDEGESQGQEPGQVRGGSVTW